MAHLRLLEKPKSMLDIMAHDNANRMIGFRPYVSDALPQGIAVRAWLTEKTAEVMPAHLATSLRGTLNDSIISGRYGNTLDKAMGSASRHSDKIKSWVTGSFGSRECLRFDGMIAYRGTCQEEEHKKETGKEEMCPMRIDGEAV
jgi:hypothetical protein